MIICTYAELKPNARIVLSSGRVVHVIATVPLGRELLVRLRDNHGSTRDITVDPNEFALLATPDIEDTIVASLRERFAHVEFLRRI